MKKKNFFMVILLPLLIVCVSTTYAMAFGIGGYFTGGIGSGQYNNDKGFLEYSNNGTKASDSVIGGGLILDTNLAKNDLFNYRLHLGVENLTPQDSGVKADLKRFSLINTFGFGIVRTQNIRFWLGPEIGIRYLSGNKTYSYYGIESIAMEYWPIYGYDTVYGLLKDKIDYNMGGVVGGLALGININIGDNFTLAFQGGARDTYYIGTRNRKVTGLIVPLPFNKFKGTITANYLEGYGSVAALVRVGDTYSGD